MLRIIYGFRVYTASKLAAKREGDIGRKAPGAVYLLGVEPPLSDGVDVGLADGSDQCSRSNL